MLCNYLQNVAAITYIFVLQLSTFLFYNKQCFSQYYKGEEQESMSKTVLNYERRTQNSYNFSARLASFWDILVEELKKAEGMEEGEEPLIYLIFDDVDLVPETVSSLFSTIIKYLSHPNLIVFVTADEELLYDVVENDFNHRLGKNDELSAYGLAKRQGRMFRYGMSMSSDDLLEEKIFERLNRKMKIMEETPRFYCDKILPPASRYYLESFESCERKKTFLCGIETQDGNVVYKSIDEYVEELIHSYIEFLGIEEKEDFVHNDGKFINTYLSFFGNTARQLANEKLILTDFIESLKALQKHYKKGKYKERKQQYFQELYYIIRAFAFNTLNADSSLGMLRTEIQKFVDETILRYPEEWGIYINYAYIKGMTEQLMLSENKEQKDKGIKQSMVLFVLLFFIENILILEGKSKEELFERKRVKVHGLGNLLEAMRQIANGNELLLSEKAENGGLQNFLFIYEKIFEKTDCLAGFNAMDVVSVRNYLYALPAAADLKKENSEEQLIETLYQRNPEWLRIMTVVLTFCNEGVYNISKNRIPSYRLSDRLEIHDSFCMDRVEESRERFCNVVCQDRVKEEEARNRELTDIIRKGITDENFYVHINTDIIKNNEIRNLKTINQKLCEKKEENTLWKVYCNIFTNMEEDCFLGRIEKAVDNDDILDIRRICDGLVNEIEKSFRIFRRYTVKDKSAFDDLLEDAGLNKVKLSEDLKIDISQFNKIMRELSNEIHEAQLREEDEQLKIIYHQLSDNVEIYVETEMQRREGVKIVALYGVLHYLERIYLNFQMDRTSESNEGRIDVQRVPYREFYKSLKCKMGKKDDYLADVLKRDLREYAGRYYSSIVER